MSDISLLADVEGCAAPLSFTGVIALVIISCVLGLLWSAYNILLVNKINVETGYDGESESLVGDIPEEQKKLLIELGEKISNGAIEFLKQEYLICIIFVAIMFIVIWLLTAEGLYTAFAFVIGAVVSIICGAVGMIIATRANYKTTYCAKRSLAGAFRTAYRAGCAMGFALVSLGLLVLIVIVMIYKSMKKLEDSV